MSKIGLILVSLLLATIICLQILSAVNVFPHKSLIRVCPVKAISMQNSKAIIDQSKCIGCKRCVLGVGAIIQKPVPAVTKISELSPQKIAETESSKAVKPSPENPSLTTQKSQVSTKPIAKVTKPAHKVDPEKCIGCGLCVTNCPVNAITLIDGKAVIDADKCINCGICKNGNGADYAGCPVEAISAP